MALFCECNSTLLCGLQARLGKASLTSQQRMIQEAEVIPLPCENLDQSKRPHTFVWHMCMRDSGCWMVQSIDAVPAGRLKPDTQSE